MEGSWLIKVLLTLAVIAIITGCVLLAKAYGFEEGQIAYGSGDIRYRLEKQPNGETRWVKLNSSSIAQATYQVKNNE